MRKRMIGMTVILAAALAVAKVPEAVPQSATVPMTLDHKRMTVELELCYPDGSWRSSRAWVDSGGTEVVLAEPLARAMGVDLSAMAAGGGNSFRTGTPPPPPSLHFTGSGEGSCHQIEYSQNRQPPYPAS